MDRTLSAAAVARILVANSLVDSRRGRELA